MSVHRGTGIDHRCPMCGDRCSCPNTDGPGVECAHRCLPYAAKTRVDASYEAGYRKGAEDCSGSLERTDEIERQRDAAWLECRSLRDALIGLRALVKAELGDIECVDIDKADSALANRSIFDKE